MSELFDLRLSEWREQIDNCLNKIVDDSAYSDEFKEILKYALFPGGKRLRPVLFLEWHNLYAPPDENALLFACALELMHSFSLIHDDMPCVDNDDVRRGKPTVHKQYGEGKALLAGDALLDLSYACMLDACISSGVKNLNCLTALRGDIGIMHGQYLDLYSHCESLRDLMEIYEKKTAALIRAACVTGYTFMQSIERSDFFDILMSQPTDERDHTLAPEVKLAQSANRFGLAFGIAFQIYDDLSEYVAGEETDGPSILDFTDLDSAKAMLNGYLNLAMSELSHFDGDTRFLRELAEKIVIV